MTVGRSTSPTHRIGAAAEDAAVRLVLDAGYQLIAQNFHSPYGEIDLIIKKDNVLVFVEVRHRKAHAQVSAAQSISVAKQRKISRCAEFFLQQSALYQHHEMRFDVITSCSGQSKAVTRQLDWIEAAFYTC